MTYGRPASASDASRLRNASSLVLALLVVPGAGSPSLASEAWQAKVDPWVSQSISRFGVADYFAFLDLQADLGRASTFRTKEERGRFVFEKLTSTARRTQRELLTMLEARGVEHRSFWVANMIWVRSGAEAVEMLASRSEVRRVIANPRVAMEPLARAFEPGATAAKTGVGTRGAGDRGAAESAIESSIVHVGAPSEFWASGFEGQGVVIGGGDTGYNWRHPALMSSYRGWNGSEVDHNYNWHDAIHTLGGSCGSDSSEPCDDRGHGTHTMGTMVGDDGGANRIGIAPAARWIGCRNMDQGVGSPATYSECFQWFIAPTDLAGNNPDPARAPDVINNSWSCPPSEGCTDPNILRAVVENTRAAGILVVASAGNGGPFCGSINTPIAIYDAVLTVGATDNGDEIAGFSSRGSSRADRSSGAKPDLVAPGILIRSSIPSGSYDRFSGTSMSGPHVTGMAALVLSAAECKRGRPSELEQHLLDSALPRPVALCSVASPDSVPNRTYGFGVLRAVLPACRLDGRVAGLISRLETSKAVCKNKGSGRKVAVPLHGLRMFNCMARGFSAAAGDTVRLKVKGTVRGQGEAEGEVAGLVPTRAVCKNKTTGSRIRIPLTGSTSWNCEDAGLVVGAGDKLEMIVFGKAVADSEG